MKHLRIGFSILLALSAAACAHSGAGSGGDVLMTPTPNASDSPTPPPTACNAAATDSTVVFIAMGSAIAAVQDPKYGILNGYGATDSSFLFPEESAAITVSASANTVQFVNIEQTGIYHSAVGFPGATAFPSRTYTFPPAVASPLPASATIGDPSAKQWSTGEIAPQGATGIGYCFSQEFKLKPGTYFFGDSTYFGLSNMEGVLIVTQ